LAWCITFAEKGAFVNCAKNNESDRFFSFSHTSQLLGALGAKKEDAARKGKGKGRLANWQTGPAGIGRSTPKKDHFLHRRVQETLDVA
jgi:hypothetical protein